MNKIKSLNLVNLSNGAHFIFMRTVVEQVATETAITGNTVAKTAIEDLKTALKKENEVYALSKANRNTAAKPARGKGHSGGKGRSGGKRGRQGKGQNAVSGDVLVIKPDAQGNYKPGNFERGKS